MVGGGGGAGRLLRYWKVFFTAHRSLFFFFAWCGPGFFSARIMSIKTKQKKVYYISLYSDRETDTGLIKRLAL